ncbi:hypothetical protein [Hyphomonas sp. GM-8P]|uniref:hypothetical protein n=1 Tax=Hyphomonas sp. GM-8P TaxID=1280945 RepID=UPI000DBFAAF0|nr:hypothetical protein [Hyphomonas sp. GM-8P]RAN39963.1 hypothetical protein HY26_14375 [Hyphomonas sp. GM-8P]
MNAIDRIRRRITKVLEATEDACGQAVEAQLPVLPDHKRLQEIQALGALLDKAKSHCDKAEAAMLKYIRLQNE